MQETTREGFMLSHLKIDAKVKIWRERDEWISENLLHTHVEKNVECGMQMSRVEGLGMILFSSTTQWNVDCRAYG
jgi:hypothetical protein